MLKFYPNPMSRGQIARWMLEEVGEPYEEVLVGYGPEMKSAEYLALNPMGKVPTLVHDGRVVTECAAICTYLADAFPAASLAPAPGDRADYYRWMFFAAGPVESAIMNRSMGWDPEGEKQAMSGYGHYDLTMDTLEKAVRAHPYIAGDRFTAADVYVGSQVGWGIQFATMPDRPAFHAYWERISAREGYQKAKARDNELIAAQSAQSES